MFDAIPVLFQARPQHVTRRRKGKLETERGNIRKSFGRVTQGNEMNTWGREISGSENRRASNSDKWRIMGGSE